MTSLLLKNSDDTSLWRVIGFINSKATLCTSTATIRSSAYTPPQLHFKSSFISVFKVGYQC